MENRFKSLSKEETEMLLNGLKRLSQTDVLYPNPIREKLENELRQHQETFYMGTLREYLILKSCGAYHHFTFIIGTHVVDVIGVEDFCAYYRSELLDQYKVIEDKTESNNGNCETYQCNHYLTIEKIKNEEDK